MYIQLCKQLNLKFDKFSLISTNELTDESQKIKVQDK